MYVCLCVCVYVCSIVIREGPPSHHHTVGLSDTMILFYFCLCIYDICTYICTYAVYICMYTCSVKLKYADPLFLLPVFIYSLFLCVHICIRTYTCLFIHSFVCVCVLHQKHMSETASTSKINQVVGFLEGVCFWCFIYLFLFIFFSPLLGGGGGGGDL